MSERKPTNKERDIKIVSAVRAGRSYASIGRDTGISGNRVAQVYMKHRRSAAYMHGCRPRYGQAIEIELSDAQMKAYFDTRSSQRFTIKDSELYGLGDRIRLIFESNKIRTKNDLLDGIKNGKIKAHFAKGYGHQSHEKACGFVSINYDRKIDKSLELQYVKYLESRGYKVTR